MFSPKRPDCGTVRSPGTSLYTLKSSTLTLLLICLLSIMVVPGVKGQQHPLQTPEEYRVYSSAGERITLNHIIDALDSTDVLFIGEQHDDSLTHVLQLELLSRAYHRFRTGTEKRPVTLSLEMFERDVQYILDEYLRGFISEQHFLASSRPWGNYTSDYRNLVEFAKSHGLDIIAANAPRRYVNMVSRRGPGTLTALSEQARVSLPPFPYAEASEAYRQKWERLMRNMMPAQHPVPDSAKKESDATNMESTAPVHPGPSYMLDAQSLWDASMAYSISSYLEQNPNALVIHMVGNFHVEERSGIPEHLNRYRPATRMVVVVSVSVDDFSEFDLESARKLGDFILVTRSRKGM